MLDRWLPERACPWLALALILAAAAARVALLLGGTGLDLSPDEAHYWDWSRQPDWAYYSKGPLVAWLIRASSTNSASNLHTGIVASSSTTSSSPTSSPSSTPPCGR